MATVMADDYRFSPAVLELGVAARVRVENAGAVEHTWTVLAVPVGTEADLGNATVLVEARVDVGQRADVDVSSLGPGRYPVVCAIPGHLSNGMAGELVVG